ncbi:MAG: M20/M25/M40 family metallo-hydrolase, partial [Ignavibacteria bacterium]|nr:M20/M25/M40 family metallo-hydrolase [Ignavibacteria bacterium]
SKHNAIPRECFATIRVAKKSIDDVKGYVEHYNEIVKSELATVEPTLLVAAENSKSKSKVIDKSTANNLIDSLYAVPNGVIKMSADIEGLVETSTNLAVVSTKGKYFEVILSHRSSVESEKKDLTNSIAALFARAKTEGKQGDGCAGWKPNINSPILGVMKKVFHEKLGKEPEVKAIHAGLECGIILERFPHLDIISFGPTIFGAHSPDEKVQISTVETFWNNLTEALKNIPVK